MCANIYLYTYKQLDINNVENSINKRIFMLITQKGLNKNSFSVAINESPQTTGKVVSGVQPPNYKYLYNIIKAFPDTDAYWLLMGHKQKNAQSDEYVIEIEKLKEKNKELEDLLEQWKELAKIKTHK